MPTDQAGGSGMQHLPSWASPNFTATLGVKQRTEDLCFSAPHSLSNKTHKRKERKTRKLE